MRRLALPAAQQGFTLIELIMVIVLMGVIGGIVSVFMKSPIDAYIASGRRAALTDTADITMRRIGRDLQRALPNSVRVNASNNCLEFIPTKTGGRYRKEGSGALVFDSAVTSFNMLGDYTSFAGATLPAGQTITAGDLIVIYNLGITGADAYAADGTTTGTNWSTVSNLMISKSPSPVETTIPINAFQFPLPSGSNRFHVVSSTEKMVSYFCSTSTNTLYRTVSNTLTPSVSCPSTGSKIATYVDCASVSTSFALTDTGNVLNRNALVNMKLTIKDSTGTESVTLQHEVHVDNTP